MELFKWIVNAFKPLLIFVKAIRKKTRYLTESWIRLCIYWEISVLLYRGRRENILCFNTLSWLQQNIKSLTNDVFKNLPRAVYPSSMWKRVVSKSLVFFFFFQLFIKVYQRFTCIHMTKLIAHKFSRGRRRLIQTYLYKFVEMTKLRVLTHCNITDISLNRML